MQREDSALTHLRGNSKPRIAIVGVGIRRDNVIIQAEFRNINITSFYQNTFYDDLIPEDIASGNYVQYLRVINLIDKSKRFKPFLKLIFVPILLFGSIELLYKLVKYKPHLIVTVEPEIWPRALPCYLSGYLVSKILRIPLVYSSEQNLLPNERYAGAMSYMLKKFINFYAAQTSFITLGNRDGLRLLIEAGVSSSKAKFCNWTIGAVNLDEFSPEKNGQEPDWGHCRVMLFVGNLIEDKGLLDLLDAFQMAKKNFSGEIKLIICGKGPLEGELREYIDEYKLHKNILMLGTVKNRDLPAYFRSADITITPSITTRRWAEHVGMVNIQSLACGTPVISTRSGSIPEFVKHKETGLLVLERNPSRLARAILTLLSDNELRLQMGQRARKYAVEHFDARKHVTRTEKVVLNFFKNQKDK